MKSTLVLLVAFCSLGAQTLPVTRDNNNYPKRNPFYFEGRITWELLGIDAPRDTWEYLQRGIHKQDDLEDMAGAIADYKQSIALSNLANNTCQLVTAKNSPPAISAAAFSALTPAPCMFTPRLRLANLLLESDPHQAIDLFEQVLEIDPLRLGVNHKIAEAYLVLAEEAHSAEERTEAYQHAVAALKAELALTPVNALTTKLTGDEAVNPHAHWELAEVYEKLGQKADAVASLENYLKATKWHSDTYPWRIKLAEKRIEELRSATWGDQLPGAKKGNQ